MGAKIFIISKNKPTVPKSDHESDVCAVGFLQWLFSRIFFAGRRMPEKFNIGTVKRGIFHVAAIGINLGYLLSVFYQLTGMKKSFERYNYGEKSPSLF